jgi:hypothetical protein
MAAHMKLIHDKLIEVAKAGPFYPVKELGETMTVGTTAVAPKIYARESSSSFGPAINHRTRVLDRDDWEWILVLKFQTQVTAEAFEEAWMSGLPVVASTADNRQVTLELVDAAYAHPERGQPSQGTTISYTVRAQIGPR